MAVETNGRKVTRDDLQQAFSRFLGDGETAARAKVPQAAVVGAAVVVSLVALAFVAGRRRGRRRSAVVVVRRL